MLRDSETRPTLLNHHVNLRSGQRITHGVVSAGQMGRRMGWAESSSIAMHKLTHTSQTHTQTHTQYIRTLQPASGLTKPCSFLIELAKQHTGYTPVTLLENKVSLYWMLSEYSSTQRVQTCSNPVVKQSLLCEVLPGAGGPHRDKTCSAFKRTGAEDAEEATSSQSPFSIPKETNFTALTTRTKIKKQQ